MNLPTHIQFANNRSIAYKYDAAGVKLQKTVDYGNQQVVTDYMSGFQYEANKLLFFPTAEGYIKAIYKDGSTAPNAYQYIYNYTDHLGNIRLSYTLDESTNQIKTLEENHYYPFGLRQNYYNIEKNKVAFKSNSTNEKEIKQTVIKAYKYKYNNKELQDELDLDWYDYGARRYDASLGRWMSTDPLADKYYKFSPYVYVGNSPTIAVDPDGKRILFVNGYWNSWIGGIIGSSSPGKKYWGSGFTGAAQRFFGDYSSVSDSNYIDGSSYFGGDSSGGGREKDGYAYAKENYTTLIDGLGEDETFKLVTHSEGGAYGAGVARYLIEKGHTVESIVHLSTDEGDEFETPNGPDTYQLGYGGDWVTGNKEISKGVDVFGIVDKYEKKSDKRKYAHGSTKGSSVFKAVKALLKLASEGATGINVTETKSGVKFEIIRDNNNEDEQN